MSVLRVLVVDDEPLIRAGIRAELSSMPDVHVAGECGSVEEAVQSIRAGGLDLVLLDVQMPDGTGFDVIRRVGLKQMPAVVFVTAYDQYAIQADEFSRAVLGLRPVPVPLEDSLCTMAVIEAIRAAARSFRMEAVEPFRT